MKTEKEFTKELQKMKAEQNLGLGEIELLKAMFEVSKEILNEPYWAGDVPENLIKEFEKLTTEIRNY